MELVRYPDPSTWSELFARPSSRDDIERPVTTILDAVRRGGDVAIRKLTAQYDGVDLNDCRIPEADIEAAHRLVAAELRDAIDLARGNIERFHASQRPDPIPVETSPGIAVWQRALPIPCVGLYVPGGTAPLFSTLLMLGVPAVLAGCERVVICTPPRPDGTVHPAVLFTADRLGLREVYRVGGAQAIAALAYGTASIPRVDKIFGPGNAYVSAAKQLVQREGVAIDLPAGPSEVAIVADGKANAAFVAADLLAQLEHDATSQALLVSDDEDLLSRVGYELARQLASLPRRTIVEAAMRGSRRILVRDLDEAVALVNAYAPEHLGLATRDAAERAGAIRNAGTVLLGDHASEVLGDYASGVNHTLPTNGAARAYGGVSLESFLKRITFQSVSPAGLQAIAPAVETMAAAEGLEGHRRAVALRRENISHAEGVPA